jgi:hypothetical protein
VSGEQSAVTLSRTLSESEGAGEGAETQPAVRPPRALCALRVTKSLPQTL